METKEDLERCLKYVLNNYNEAKKNQTVKAELHNLAKNKFSNIMKKELELDKRADKEDYEVGISLEGYGNMPDCLSIGRNPTK